MPRPGVGKFSGVAIQDAVKQGDVHAGGVHMQQVAVGVAQHLARVVAVRCFEAHQAEGQGHHQGRRRLPILPLLGLPGQRLKIGVAVHRLLALGGKALESGRPACLEPYGSSLFRE